MSDDLIVRGLIQIQIDGKSIDEAVVEMQKIVANAEASASKVGNIGTAATEAGKQVGYLEEQFAALGSRIVAGLGVIELTRFLKDSFLEFANLDRGFSTLAVELGDFGSAASRSLPQVKQFLETLGEQTGQLESALVPAMTRLLLTTDNVTASQELLTIAANFARAGFGDLESNAERLALALQTGQVRSLRPFGIELKDTEGKTIDLGEAFRKLSEKSELLKKLPEDAQSKVEGWRRAWEDFSVGFGHGADTVVNWLYKVKKASDDLALSKFLDPEGTKKYLDQIKHEQRVMEDTAQGIKEYNASLVYGPRNATMQELADIETANAKKEAARKLAEDIAKSDFEARKAELESELPLYEKSSQERLDREQRLNQMMLDEALRAANLSEAAKANIRQAFANRAGVNVTERQKAIDADREEIEKMLADREKARQEELAAEQRHQDEITRLEDEGEVDRLRHLKDLTLQGTAARYDAEAALQKAELQLKSDREIAAAKHDADATTAIRQKQADDEQEIDAVTSKLKQDQRRAELAGEADAYGRATASMLEAFGKHKAAALGLLAVNTATAVMNAWAHSSSWEEALAETLAIAAAAEVQRQRIESASASGGSGGSGGGGGGGGAAASPRFAAMPTSTSPPAFTPGSGQASGMAPISNATVNAVSGGRFGSSGGGLTIQIGTAFGDRPAMTRLTNDIVRVIRNNQSVLR